MAVKLVHLNHNISLNNGVLIDEKKARKLIRLFRPSRDGSLTALDFVKSCDKIYKDLRTLRAAISNSSQLDLAFERLINVGFYFVLWLIILTIVKLDPWTLFLSLSGVSAPCAIYRHTSLVSHKLIGISHSFHSVSSSLYPSSQRSSF